MTWPALARENLMVAAGKRASMGGLALALVLTSANASAQFEARTWRPSTDADASLVLEPAATAGAGRWNLGVSTQYARYMQTVSIAQGRSAEFRQSSVVSDLVAGLGLGSRFAVGLDVPVEYAPDVVLGALALNGKATLLSNDRDGVRSGFGVAALATAIVHTGASAFDDSVASPVNVQVAILGEFAVGIGAVRAEVGYSAPGSRERWPALDSSAGALPSAPRPVTFEDTIPWALGIVVRPKVFSQALDNGDRQLWELAAHGWLPGGPDVAPFGLGGSGVALLSPVLLALDDRVALGHHREVFVTAGGELGLDDAIGVPTFRAIIALGWAPRSHDKDGDGVDDDIDQCPDLPEDRDGIQDADGCPEDDADGDEILDKDDACPLVPGVPSSDPKRNGCPGEALATPPPVPIEEKPRESSP